MTELALPIAYKPFTPVVVFDSGVGGLSVLEYLIAQRPDLRYIYVADTDWMPYGTKAPHVLAARLEQLARQVLQLYGARQWVLACNTASAALAHVETVTGGQSDKPVQFLDIIKPTVDFALESSRQLLRDEKQTGPVVRIGVLATESTIKSNRYPMTFEARRTHEALEVRGFSGIGLAQAVEGKPFTGPAGARLTLPELIEVLVEPINAWHPDLLCLACTHYLHIEGLLREAIVPSIQLINPAKAVTQACLPSLPPPPAFRCKRFNPDWLHVLSTGSPESFMASVAALKGFALTLPQAELLCV